MLMYQIYLRKKDFFSYDYWDSFEKFKEGLSSKNKFYNALTKGSSLKYVRSEGEKGCPVKSVLTRMGVGGEVYL